MNAQTLMIGNYVTWDDNYDLLQVRQVSSDFMMVDKYGVEEGDGSEDQFYPITLTEEWFEKLGFRWLTGNWVYSKSITQGTIKVEFNYDSEKARLLNVGGYIGVEFKYVHELQNIYLTLFDIKLRLPDNDKLMNSI